MSLKTLHSDYPHFFDHFLQRKYDRVFFMAIDAEWFDEGGKNTVLSYQIATAAQSCTNNVIVYMEHGKRLTLAEILVRGIRSVTPVEVFENLRGGKTLVVLVSHNFAAEWSVLADRDEPYITKRLTVIRKSPVTDGHPIKLVLNDALPVDVHVFDTMLISPASHKSLKKLSALLGSKEEEKESITQFFIERMDRYLQDHPEKFQNYALKDSEITLRLFFLLQQALNDLVSGGFRLYRTLGSAGVRAFLQTNPWFEDYRKGLRGPQFSTHYALIKRSYLGGRNEGYFIGKTEVHPETRNCLWLDIDFTGCYPTAMALCPRIDLSGEVDHIPLRYSIDDKVAADLAADNIPATIIGEARTALLHSPLEFDRVLAKISSKHMAHQIRDKVTVIDNRLISKWHGLWQKAKQDKGSNNIEKFLIPGFARVRFRFPAGTLYPCLPVKDQRYGLIYPLEGETTVPAPEIMLALEAGAQIEALTSLELPVERDEHGEPVRLAMDYLGDMATKRSLFKEDKENPKAQVFEKLLKEFVNSLYGKLAQGINHRKVFQASTREEVWLGESLITEPCTAALVTSQARAALSACLVAIERVNKTKTPSGQIPVISATTDGLLVGIPVPEGFKGAEEFHDRVNGIPKLKKGVEGQLGEIMVRFGCGEVLKEIEGFLPIKQMHRARLEMTGNSEIFEIKHMADSIVSVKTRGQIGLLATGEVTLLARFGHSIPLSEIVNDPEEYKRLLETGGVVRDTTDAAWLLGHIQRIENGRDTIDKYNAISLTSPGKMMKSEGQLDLTKQITPRKINVDFDWKRRLLKLKDDDLHENQVSPFTVPHLNISEMRQCRWQMEAIRKTGRVARPEAVIHRVAIKGRTTRTRGGEPVTVARLFIRGLVQGKFQLTSTLPPYPILADGLNIAWDKLGLTQVSAKKWSFTDVKNAKRGIWAPGSILPNATLVDLVVQLALHFGADPDRAKAAIFAGEEYTESHVALIEQIITATTNAHDIKIEPFLSLYQQGYLPTKQKITEAFGHQLSGDQIDACQARPFIPGQRPSGDAKKLKRLFYLLGIPSAKAEVCAKCIAPPMPSARTLRHNPGKKRCAEHFLMALLQPDLNTGGVNPKTALGKIKAYGVTKASFHRLTSAKFNPNSIRNTSENRHQIGKMARSVGLDPLPFLGALIEI